LGKAFDFVERLASIGSGYLITFLMLLVVCDVIYRFTLSKSIAGAYTLSEMIMVGICFLALSFTQKEKGHVAVDFVVVRLEGKPYQTMEIISSLLSFVICVLLFYRATIEARIAVDIRLVTSGIVEWPAWPLKIVVAFGFLLLGIRVAIQLSQQIYFAFKKRRNHVA